METINDEDLSDVSFLDPAAYMKELQFGGGDDSSYIDEEETITEYTTEEEGSEEDFSEEEVVPIPPKAEGKRVASPMPPGDQPLDKRPRQSTADEDFDIVKVVEAIEKNPLWKMSHKAALWEKYEKSLTFLFERVVLMEIEAQEEVKNNKEFREEMEKILGGGEEALGGGERTLGGGQKTPRGGDEASGRNAEVYGSNIQSLWRDSAG